MSWEHPTAEEHKDFSSTFQVYYGSHPHEGWDIRWYHEKTYQTDGGALHLARKLQKHNDGSVRVVQCWFNGETFQSEIIYEALGL